MAEDFALAFSKPSKDRSGKATLVRWAGRVVPGVLFEIEVAQRPALDRHEGAGHGYERLDDFAVVAIQALQATTASTYVATTLVPTLKPYDWYLALVIAGALHHDLDTAHIATLRATPYSVDPEQDRPARQCAVHAMRKHGVTDFRTLL